MNKLSISPNWERVGKYFPIENIQTNVDPTICNNKIDEYNRVIRVMQKPIAEICEHQRFNLKATDDFILIYLIITDTFLQIDFVESLQKMKEYNRYQQAAEKLILTDESKSEIIVKTGEGNLINIPDPLKKVLFQTIKNHAYSLNNPNKLFTKNYNPQIEIRNNLVIRLHSYLKQGLSMRTRLITFISEYFTYLNLFELPDNNTIKTILKRTKTGYK